MPPKSVEREGERTRPTVKTIHEPAEKRPRASNQRVSTSFFPPPFGLSVVVQQPSTPGHLISMTNHEHELKCEQ